MKPLTLGIALLLPCLIHSRLCAQDTSAIPLPDIVTASLKFFRPYDDLFKKGLASSEQLNKSLSQADAVGDKMQQAGDRLPQARSLKYFQVIEL